MKLSANPAATQLYSHGDPTPEEQLMQQLVNRARANPAAEAARFGIDLNEGITNNPISPAPKQPLAFNASILQAARAHSQWMLDNDIFAHVETNGSDPGARMRAAGYVFSGSWTYGENIGWRGNQGVAPAVGPTVVLEHEDLFVDDGITDRGHRRDILQEDFREIGIGVRPGIFTYLGKDYSAVMVTQDFGATAANPGPFLVGVVYRDLDGDGAYSVGEGLAGVKIVPAQGTSYAVSSTSGGYAIPLTGLSGTLQVTFSGAPLPAPITKSVSLTGMNVALNFEFNVDTIPQLGFAPGTARLFPNRFVVSLQGPANARVSVQASPNGVQWIEISQVTLVGNAGQFTDSTVVQAHRYYRLVKL